MANHLHDIQLAGTRTGPWYKQVINLGSVFNLYTYTHTSSLFSLIFSPAHSTHPETRTRYWNAYMLFYEAVDHPNQSTLPRRRSSDINPMSPLGGGVEVDKLSQLQVSVRLLKLWSTSYLGYNWLQIYRCIASPGQMNLYVFIVLLF